MSSFPAVDDLTHNAWSSDKEMPDVEVSYNDNDDAQLFKADRSKLTIPVESRDSDAGAHDASSSWTMIESLTSSSRAESSDDDVSPKK